MLTRVARDIRNRLRMSVRVLRNRVRLAALQRERSLRVHLGCGDDRLPGFVNIDYRPTAAVDVAMDLSLPRLADGSVSLAFSNAFFEHLYRPSRGPHLRRIRQALAPDGACCYMGIPYFPNIARLYVERGPGTAGPVFDLFNVYRYTHGDPEGQAAWWLGQLHKSLFDEEEVAALLAPSGFGAYRDVLLRLSGRRQRSAGDDGVLRHVRGGGAGRVAAAVPLVSRPVRRHPHSARHARMAAADRGRLQTMTHGL